MSEPVQAQTVLAYWLLPAAPAGDFFRRTVARLATKYEAPLFEPHLTLAVGPDDAAEAHRILTGIAAGPIELQAAGTHFTAKFTRTLFVRFSSSPQLEQLRSSLGLVAPNDDPFDPHVSLRNAELQVPRVAKARALSEDKVRELVQQNTDGRDLGVFGDPGVNVLQLNLALDGVATAP